MFPKSNHVSCVSIDNDDGIVPVKRLLPSIHESNANDKYESFVKSPSSLGIIDPLVGNGKIIRKYVSCVKSPSSLGIVNPLGRSNEEESNTRFL